MAEFEKYYRQVTASAAALSAARLRNLASGHLGTACREYRIPAGASRYIDRLTEPGWTCYALIINAPGESTSQGCQRRCHAGVSIQDPSTGPSGMTRPARNGRRRSRRRSWSAWASPGRVGESAGTAWLPPVSKPSVRRSGYTHRSFRPDNQRVDAPQRHGVDVHEVSCEDAAGLRGQELPPGRAGPAGRRIDPGVMQDLPHRGSRDPVTEPGPQVRPVSRGDLAALHLPGHCVQVADVSCPRWESSPPTMGTGTSSSSSGHQHPRECLSGHLLRPVSCVFPAEPLWRGVVRGQVRAAGGHPVPNRTAGTARPVSRASAASQVRSASRPP
jgi:hypothetical protein